MITASVYGRLGRDPEQRTTRTGKPMTTGSIAVDVTPYGHDGDAVTCWVSLAAFGAAGEVLAQHMARDMVACIGRLTLQRWTDREGHEREGWQMTVEALHSSRTVRPSRVNNRRKTERVEV